MNGGHHSHTNNTQAAQPLTSDKETSPACHTYRIALHRGSSRARRQNPSRTRIPNLFVQLTAEWGPLTSRIEMTAPITEREEITGLCTRPSRALKGETLVYILRNRLLLSSPMSNRLKLSDLVSSYLEIVHSLINLKQRLEHKALCKDSENSNVERH